MSRPCPSSARRTVGIIPASITQTPAKLTSADVLLRVPLDVRPSRRLVHGSGLRSRSDGEGTSTPGKKRRVAKQPGERPIISERII